VKGTVSFSVQPLTSYPGALLATFLVTDRTLSAGGSYQIGLSLFRTLGPTETVFVDGAGHALDGGITFGSAEIEVVPELRSTEFIFLAAGCWLVRGGVRGWKGGGISRA
jgi:hypothetical protein